MMTILKILISVELFFRAEVLILALQVTAGDLNETDKVSASIGVLSNGLLQCFPERVDEI